MNIKQNFANNQKIAYTINDVQRALSISRASVYRVINRGEIKTVKIGRRRLVLRGDLEAFLTWLARRSAQR